MASSSWIWRVVGLEVGLEHEVVLVAGQPGEGREGVDGLLAVLGEEGDGAAEVDQQPVEVAGPGGEGAGGGVEPVEDRRGCWWSGRRGWPTRCRGCR